MAFCPQCGAPGEGRFCAGCGAEMAGGGPAVPAVVRAAGLQENIAAALCYAGGIVTGVIFLALAPYNQNRTIRFHAWQAILGHAAMIAVFVAVLPMLPGWLAVTLGPLLGFGSFVLWLALMWKAYNNQRLVIPVIGEFAEKQA